MLFIAQRCLQLEPYNEVCQYMKGLSHVAMGQFYEGIKAQTKVMLNDPLLGQKASSEYLKVKYLRGEKLKAFVSTSMLYSRVFSERHSFSRVRVLSIFALTPGRPCHGVQRGSGSSGEL